MSKVYIMDVEQPASVRAISDVIEMWPRRLKAVLIERLIDHLDDLDGDPECEDDDADECVDDMRLSASAAAFG